MQTNGIKRPLEGKMESNITPGNELACRTQDHNRILQGVAYHILLLVAFTATTARGQDSESGRLLVIPFNTQGHGITRPDGFNVDQAAFAELWVGKNREPLRPVAGPVQLNEHRQFEAGTVSLPGFKVGDTVQLRLKVCFGDDFDNSDCCGFSRIEKHEIDSPNAFRVHHLFFGFFEVCEDCDPDACFTLHPSLEFEFASQTLSVTWLGGRLEAANQVEGPFTPFFDGLYFLDAGTHREPARGAARFFRVVDPCINPDPVDWNADYIEAGLISKFWEELLERTLKVMGEPSLLSIDSAEDREVYRMFFLPSFGLSTVVRFERNGNQFTKKVVMTGSGNSPLERCILHQETIQLDQTEWREFQTNFDRLDFWALGPENPPIRLLDGTPTFIEARKGPDYHIIERPTPDYKTGERGLSNYRSFFERWVRQKHIRF